MKTLISFVVAFLFVYLLPWQGVGCGYIVTAIAGMAVMFRLMWYVREEYGND